MGKKIWIISVVLFLSFAVSSAYAEEQKLKYDFQYLFKWTAAAMGIEIDSKNPQPALEILLEEKVRFLYEKKEGEKFAPTIKKDGKETRLVLDGFYWFYKNTVYVSVRDEINIAEGEILEETIVHELVHYFQYFYKPSIFDDCNCLTKPFPFWNCPWEREAKGIESKFRLDHNLIMRNEDLENLMYLNK